MANLYFKVKTGLKDVIGKDLITDDNIAVFELVKNSYDAHALKVVITFEDNKITIADNGKGMSYDGLIEKWLSVAFSAKKDGTEDDDYIKRDSYRDKIKNRRFYAGAKGIGRFSCDRLGENLVLYTRKDKKVTHCLGIDWKDFEKDQTNNFEQIKINYTEIYDNIVFPDNSDSGTILEITNISSWDRDKIKSLKHSLEKLINPFSETTDFEIEVVCERELERDDLEQIERDKINGTIRNSIVDILKLKTTEITVSVTPSKINTQITDRGTLIYHIEETNLYNPFIEDLRINLYYLNRSAKFNFTKRMGIEPVNYGSVFLFKNGFRVQPYGERGIDSWRLDYRSQQGYNRTLGTRDLFGRMDIVTDNNIQFKEVSSRDGGLSKTSGYKQLIDIFEKAHRRLERYVTGVLWGEAFKRNKYFNSEDEAQRFRDALLEKDKDSEDISIAQSNIGSKIDFIRLIKSLSDEKDVRIIDYNKELVDLVNENLTEVQPKFLKDLEKIAETTCDETLLRTISLTEESFNRLTQEKEDAIIKAKESEERALIAEQNRIIAEEKAKKAHEDKLIAELEKEKKEKERAQAELEKVLAEKRAQQAEEERDVEKSKNKYLVSTRNISKEAEDVLHTIKISSNELSAAAKNIKRELDSRPEVRSITSELDYIFFHVQRINKLSKLLTKADINILKEKTKVNIAEYIKEYLPNYKSSLTEITFSGTDDIIKKIPLLDLSVILDNLLNNSIKAGAQQIHINFKRENNNFYVEFSDNGNGVDTTKFKNNEIFELGITDKRGGSGIGLSTIKETMKRDLNGDIIFVGNGLYYNSGATFKLIFR